MNTCWRGGTGQSDRWRGLDERSLELSAKTRHDVIDRADKIVPRSRGWTTARIYGCQSAKLVRSFFSPGISMHLPLRINETLFFFSGDEHDLTKP
jgi:hypothetical protein